MSGAERRREVTDTHVEIVTSADYAKVSTFHPDVRRMREMKKVTRAGIEKARRAKEAELNTTVVTTKADLEAMMRFEKSVSDYLSALEEFCSEEKAYWKTRKGQGSRRLTELPSRSDDDEVVWSYLEDDGAIIDLSKRDVRALVLGPVSPLSADRIISRYGVMYRLARDTRELVKRRVTGLEGELRKAREVAERSAVSEPRELLADRTEPVVMSNASKRRLLQEFHRIDFKGAFDDDWEPVMLTLTLPGGRTAGARSVPNAEVMKSVERGFRGRFKREFGISFRGFVKREWQPRTKYGEAAGCPHWHIVTCAPRKGTGEAREYVKNLAELWADLLAKRIESEPGTSLYDDHLSQGVEVTFSQGRWSLAAASFYLSKYLSYKDSDEEKANKDMQNTFPVRFFKDTEAKNFHFWSVWGLESRQGVMLVKREDLDLVLKVMKKFDRDLRKERGDTEKYRTYTRDVVDVDGNLVADDDGVIMTHLVRIENTYFRANRFLKDSASAWMSGVAGEEVEAALRKVLGDRIIAEY